MEVKCKAIEYTWNVTEDTLTLSYSDQAYLIPKFHETHNLRFSRIGQ